MTNVVTYAPCELSSWLLFSMVVLARFLPRFRTLFTNNIAANVVASKRITDDMSQRSLRSGIVRKLGAI